MRARPGSGAPSASSLWTRGQPSSAKEDARRHISMSNTPAKLRTARCATGADPLGQYFRLRLLARRHRHPDSTGEPLCDLREVRDQDHLLEDLAHPEEFLDEEFPRDLRVEGAEVAFVDEQRLHATERAADLRHRGEFPCDRETQGRVDLRLLAPAELRDIVPLPVYSLDENPDSVTPALFVRLQADATKPTVRELGQILRGFDLQFRQELIDRIHDDTALVEHPIHEDIVDFELAAERLSLSFRLFQFHRVRFAAFSRTDWPTSSNRFSSVSVNRTASSWRNASIFASSRGWRSR